MDPANLDIPERVMTAHTSRHLAASLAAYLCAVLLVAASFAAYALRFSPVDRWQADDYDPADYRFVAEYFWDVPFEPDTYEAVWHGGWGDYLRKVPFRGIGLGSVYLLTGWLRIGHAPSTPDEVLTAGITLALVEKLLLAAALLTLFAVVRRQWGAGLAFFSLIVTAFPPHFWRISDDFLTEPVHRVIFLLAFACAVAMSGRARQGRREQPSRTLAFVLIGLLLGATHLKVQWYAGALLLLPALLLEFKGTTGLRRTTLLLCAATALVPLSVIAVNWIGWRTMSLNPGIGLHINLKYEGDVLREFSALTAGTAERPAFADPERPRLRWWNIYVGSDVSRDDYEAFDRFAREYVRGRPRSVARALWEGLGLASTVPGIERIRHGLIRLEPLDEPWSTPVRYADLAVWALLVLGLAFAETRLACALGLTLWIVPAIGHIVSPYELRYHLPTAGLGALASGCVLVTLGQRVRRQLSRAAGQGAEVSRDCGRQPAS